MKIDIINIYKNEINIVDVLIKNTPFFDFEDINDDIWLLYIDTYFIYYYIHSSLLLTQFYQKKLLIFINNIIDISKNLNNVLYNILLI